MATSTINIIIIICVALIIISSVNTEKRGR